ncbi:MAG: ABC transporter permease [Rhodospirillaceae bacterium]|nr:ABC transporter permease [Rhodospirillaceae bacterium]
MTLATDTIELPRRDSRRVRIRKYCRRHPTVPFGLGVLGVMIIISILGPYFTVDPLALSPFKRLKPPSGEFFFGTDMYGREVFARTLAGGRISLAVGISVALVSTVVGLAIGIVSGYVRALDAVVMRVMDGLMAIPGVLLAIALISLTSASISNVIIAITIPEVPRVVRLVRAVVLSIREQPYIQAAVSVGMPLPRILWKHVLPNTLAPLIVQATYICASAVIVEAILSFLGAGTPPEIPSWGNIMAEGRTYFQITPWIILFPGLFLAITVLAVNVLGDGLRDSLDPRIARRMR